MLPRGEFLIYDAEVLCPPRPPDSISSFQYADSWLDYLGMGVSVVCAYDGKTGSFTVYFADDGDGLKRFGAFAQDRIVIGFNSKMFDDPLLAANGCPVVTCFDLLSEVRLASGQPPFYESGRMRSGYGLSSLCHANFSEGKSGDGVSAGLWWQVGQKARVVNYCLNDVRLTARLLARWADVGALRDPNDASYLDIADTSADFRQFLGGVYV